MQRNLVDAWRDFRNGNPKSAIQLFAENAELDYFGRIIQGKTNIKDFLEGFKRDDLKNITSHIFSTKCSKNPFVNVKCECIECSYEIYFPMRIEYVIENQRATARVNERAIGITLNTENLVERAKVSKRQKV